MTPEEELIEAIIDAEMDRLRNELRKSLRELRAHRLKTTGETTSLPARIDRLLSLDNVNFDIEMNRWFGLDRDEPSRTS